jgi:hypothetical protein
LALEELDRGDKSHAVADAMVCSKSLASRRFLLSHTGPFDDPTPRQHLEALGGVGPLDDLDRPFADATQGVPELSSA